MALRAVAGAGSGSSTAPNAGPAISYATGSGQQVDVAPPGFGPTIGRLLVTGPAGTWNWTSLQAGTDGQVVTIYNLTGATGTLTVQSPVGTANERFAASSDAIMANGQTRTLTYWAGTVNRWVITS